MDSGMLDIAADRIELILAQHKTPVSVDGGVVTPRWVRFHVTPASGTRLARVQSLAEEIALALGTPEVRVTRNGTAGAIQIDVPRDDPQVVKLLELCKRLPAVPLGTAVLGIADDGAPLLLRLPSPDVAHVLVAGAAGSGKTALVLSTILSLALAHRRSQLQLVLIDNDNSAFVPLAGLSHILAHVEDPGDGLRMLKDAAALVDRRERDRVNLPRIVIAIDDVMDLIARNADDVCGSVAYIARHGRAAGVHLVICTHRPSAEALKLIVRQFPVRLVGRVASIEDARVATGVGDSSAALAQRLCGRGDFLAVSGAGITRFQAAFISSTEIERLVQLMNARDAQRSANGPEGER